MLDNTPNQPSKFRKKNWVEINDSSRGTYNTSSQIKFKISCIAVKGTLMVPNTRTVAAPKNRDAELVLKNCALCTIH